MARAICGPDADEIGNFTKRPKWECYVKDAQRAIAAIHDQDGGLREALTEKADEALRNADELWRRRRRKLSVQWGDFSRDLRTLSKGDTVR